MLLGPRYIFQIDLDSPTIALHAVSLLYIHAHSHMHIQYNAFNGKITNEGLGAE